MIIAGAVVGSGELIATTKTGAQAGFWLLWLIIVGCVIKVFTQVEFGRYAISSGKAAMSAMDEVPGPRLRVNWLVWYWLVMFTVSIAQLGGIIGGVGQAMAMNLPIDGSFNRMLDEQDAWDHRAEEIAPTAMDTPRPDWSVPGYFWTDDMTWATVLTVLTVLMLLNGRYGVVQNFSTVMVAGFTLVTVFNVVALQFWPEWAVHWSDLRDGFSFRLPPAVASLGQVAAGHGAGVVWHYRGRLERVDLVSLLVPRKGLRSLHRTA